MILRQVLRLSVGDLEGFLKAFLDLEIHVHKVHVYEAYTWGARP
jgi:hypothetical protein